MKLEEYSKLQLIYAVYDALTYIPHEMMFGCTCWKGEVYIIHCGWNSNNALLHYKFYFL